MERPVTDSRPRFRDEPTTKPPPPPPASDQGWGRAKGLTVEQKAIQLADRLAAAVRLWESHPSMNNRERMLEACSAFERTLR